MKQYEAVIKTLEKLGGIATLAQINQEVFKIEDCEWKTKTPHASVRRIVRHTPGIFNVRKGLYALEDMKDTLVKRGLIVADANDKEQAVTLNHAYYQGLLITIGNLKGLASFVPSQDKNRKFYDGRNLGEIATLHALPHYTYPNLVKRSSTIDTIWMNERQMPHSFFEVECTTDIQNSLLKYLDLQDFNVRMVIVADETRKSEFRHKLSYHAFDELSKHHRVRFLSFDELVKQYEQEMQRSSFEFVL